MFNSTSEEFDPDEQGPKMPASIPVDAFDKMTNVARYEHLQDSVYHAALIRREYRANGPKEKVGIQSNFQRLLAMIEAPLQSDKGGAPGSPGGGGGGRGGLSNSSRVSSILNAVKSGVHFDADGVMTGGDTPRRGDYDRLLHRGDEMAHKKAKSKLAPSVRGIRDEGRTLAEFVHLDHGTNVPKDVVKRSGQAMTTFSRQATVDKAAEKVIADRSLRDSMKAATVAVRKQFVRSSSYPRAIYCVGAYRDYRDKFEVQRLEVLRLKKVCDGLEPRDQEVKQEQQLQAMEKQIINQLALIKGLREKLKILREQHLNSQQPTPQVASLSNVVAGTSRSPQETVTPRQPTIFTQLSPREGSAEPDEIPRSPSASYNLLQGNNSGTLLPNASFGPSPLLNASHSHHPHVANTSFANNSVVSVSSSKHRMGSTLRALSSPPIVAGPRGEHCAVTVLDIEAARYLWETFPDTMRTQTAILHRVIRTEAAKWRGYEALSKDDKMMHAFSNAYDACQFALQLQQALLNAEWSTVLAETPETASEYMSSGSSSNVNGGGQQQQQQFLWRGLRIKIAIDIGARAFTDPLFPNRVSYEGAAIEAADYLHKLAIGGEVLLTHTAAEAIQSYMEKLGNPIMEDWGTVTYHPSRVGVRRITSKHLQERRMAFNRALSTAERTLHEESEEAGGEHMHAPTGRVTLVSVFCPGMPVIRSQVSEQASRDTMQRAFHTLTSVARSEGGYVSQLNLDDMSFLVAFDDAFAALKFALDVQQAFVEQDWNADVLRVPQASVVKLRQKIIYNGLRAHIGVYRMTQPAVTYREPLESKVMYMGKDSKLSSLIAAAAVDGEVLIPENLLHLTTERYDDLGCPAADYVTSIPTTVSDTLSRLYQVFSENLAERSSFVARELRLADENQELANHDIVTTLRKQVTAMHEKLHGKNEWIRRLYLHLDQKTEAIGEIRKYVLKLPFPNVDITSIVAEHDEGFTFPSEVVMVAFSCASVEEMYDRDPLLMPDALDVYNVFLDRVVKLFDGREVRRLPSRIARIVSFPDAQRAIACWTHVVKTSFEEDWPPRLDDTTHAGLVMASEFFPGLSPDVVVWKGLRPTCAIHCAKSLVRFNTLTRAHEVVGDDVNVMAEMLRCASAGDCLVSAKFSSQYKERIERWSPDLQFNEYGPFIRIIDTSQRFRLRGMQPSFPPMEVNDLPTSSQIKAFVAHVTMQDTYPVPLDIAYPDDVAMFNETVIRTITEFRGQLMSSIASEYVVIFPDFVDGCRFAVHIHSELLRARWTRDVQRVLDFRELTVHDEVVLRGIRAKVGCHITEDLNVILDLFAGRDQFYHSQLNIPFGLAVTAHSGETLLSESARDALRKPFSPDASKLNFFVEPAGTYQSDGSSRKETMYQVFPVRLKARVAYFIDEDRRLNDPVEIANRKRLAMKFQKHNEKMASRLHVDATFLASTERSTNPFDDPIHRKTHKLYKKIRPQLDEERSRFITCQETLALIETVSMMAEDQLLLGDPDLGTPLYPHLMLHELENGRTCNDIFYKKDLAAELLGNVLLTDAPKTIELETNSSVAEGSQPTTSPVSHAPASGGSGLSSPLSNQAPKLPSNQNSRAQSPSQEVKCRDSGSGAVVAATTTKNMRKTVFSTNLHSIAIHPEDVVLLHIDVERFFQLLKLHGLDNPLGFANDFMHHAYAVAYPGKDPGELDGNVRWEKITSQTFVIGMDVSSIDFHKLRCSMLAYLAQSYQEISRLEW
jgi:class 3 adenylate cyclase